MFYETNYRNTRTASALAITILLLGVMIFLGSLFINFSRESDGEVNWTMITIFIPVFAGAFIPIIAAISEQKRKENARNMVQDQHFEIKKGQQAHKRSFMVSQERSFMPSHERVYTQADIQTDRYRRPLLVYCSYCGERLGEEAVFCPQCGTKTRY